MHMLFIKVGEYMKIEKLLYQLYNTTRIVYLDSSSLIRNYSVNTLSRSLTRTKYISNPKKFSIVLNRFIIPIYDTSTFLYNILDKTTSHINGFDIITYDCMFPPTSNKHISLLFGFFDFNGNIASVNNSTVLYGDDISAEAFFKASKLIRSANLIIIDDHFLALSIGRQLFNRKKEETPIITLSSIIGYRCYNTKEIIDIFNYLFSNYHIQ